MDKCANCHRSPAYIRAGWAVTGVGWQEDDYCQTCMTLIHDKMKDGMSSGALPPYSLGPVGKNIGTRSDDAAAM